ncbi:unnamed protein product [Xylocopa violacea]|uniref:C3H1-type domain-containing protein n=1 Tax=Xylocopa violacea TaxID=135666 RepID=A0ABP1N9W4_XYLVO
MASDLSSECTETIGVLDEKEEGEISLEDVSSSEEGHLNYGYGTRSSQCSNCLSTQHNASWCTAPAKFYPSKGSNRREVDLILQDAVQGKENLHQIKETGCIGTKHTASTLQEKNDDLVPISSDSDMEIVGLADNSKQIVIPTSSKSRAKKKRKKKRSHTTVLSLDDLVSPSTVDISITECVNTLKHDVTKSISRPHHRETSPVQRSRPKIISRSPPRRHRSLLRGKSPFKRSRSPIVRGRSPPIRRSPRRLKSPKRSSYKPSTKTMPRKTSHLDSISSHNYCNTHKLLKKVRQLDSIGTHSLEETLNKNKEHASSLKEKLSNMMKTVSDNNGDFTNSSKEKSTMHINEMESNDGDDEEDLALLRQKALETKQNKSNKQNDQARIETAKNTSTNINDDQDEEDLELRMIALRSAVLKKHQNRVQKGIKSGKFKKSNISRSGSPFNQSFLDSIPIPGEELLNFASPPHTPLPTSENNHTEDMELDTDVEREKEKLPYSPTDKITANISMDTELLGIQPSDVSFISLTVTNNSPSCTTSVTSNQDEQKPYQGNIIQNQSYLPNIMYYAPSQNPLCTANANMEYLQTNLTETSKTDFMKVHNSHVNVHSYENTYNIHKNNNTSEFVDINLSQEMPYSPTDTPVYDPDLLHILPQTPDALTTSCSSLVTMESYTSNMHRSGEQYNYISTIQHMQNTKQISAVNKDEQLNKVETASLDPVVGSATTSVIESVSPSSSMITIDDLPEIDADTSPVTDSLRNVKGHSQKHIPRDLSNNGKERISEPLYMRGVPDVTKDTNKIPTLINRTLVPAPILKTNKQLQLPLPTKKCVMQQEPTFKSADMQPVAINEETNTKTNTSFKPIKLPFLLKPPTMLAITNAFLNLSHEDSANEISTDKASTSLLKSTHSSTPVQNNMVAKDPDKTTDIKSSTQRRKKLAKKGLKRRSTLPLVARRQSTSYTGSDNINTVDKKINESDQTISMDDKQNQEELRIQMNVTNSTNASTSINEKNEVSQGTNKEETQSNDTCKERKSTDDRRQSLDEDEEALRALLLASLPKRAKTVNNCSISTAITTSTASNQALTNQTKSNTALPTVNTTNTSSGGTTFSSTPHTNAYGSENDKNQSNAREKINNVTQKNLSTQSVKTLNTISSGRKRLIPITKGPQKKLVKRIPVPASTKVVNNAKKYQNTKIQRRLNLQKATLYNKQKMAENKIAFNVQPKDIKWSGKTKTSDTQRIVINLESDTESDSESEWQKNTAVSSANSITLEKNQPAINFTTEFEKNLDQFLRAVRKSQESVAAARPTSIPQPPKKDTILTTKPEVSNSSNLHTPLAVRHLPASQQEEYRRLKQQILEREKLRLHRTIENSLSKSKNAELSSKSTLSNSPSKELPVKVNQTVLTKGPSISAQQLNKENCSKNLVDSVKNTTISAANVRSSINKVSNGDKQGNATSNQTKTMPRTVANLNIRISNENSASSIGNKGTGNSVQSTNTSRIVFETPTKKVQMRTKASSGLKILSTDEVNRKYVQTQVDNTANERVVTINDKVTLNNGTVTKRTENVSENKDNSIKSTCDRTQSVEKDIANSDTPPSGSKSEVDSDASTIILSKERKERSQSLDTSESTIVLSQSQDNTSSTSTPQSKEDDHFPLFKNNVLSKSTRSIEQNWEAIKKDVKTELNALINLSRLEQEQRLKETEQKLVMKRHTILDDLADMSISLRRWHMERDLQTNLVAEVKKIREQLKVAEERLQLQRNRINSIGPKVVMAHEKINVGRQECFKLANICSTLGTRLIGKEYKVPDAGAQLLDYRLKEAANHTRQLSRKKVPSINIPEIYESTRLGDETVFTECAEIAQSVDPLEPLSEECIVDADTAILNENESPIRSSQVEEVAQAEETAIDINEAAQETNLALHNSTPNSVEKDSLEQNNTEQEVLSEQTNLCEETSLATADVLNTKDAQEPDSNKEASENTVVRPTTSESDSEKRNTTRSNGNLQRKKTLLPYESILMHFKIPRNTNPNGILCPYELMGTCSDGDCQFIHHTESQAK